MQIIKITPGNMDAGGLLLQLSLYWGHTSAFSMLKNRYFEQVKAEVVQC